MHVRGFTEHASSQVKQKGKFLGVIEKIPHLKSLGINAVELLPVFEFDETHYMLESTEDKKRYNYWGYSPINFFQPMNRYATSSEIGSSLNEFREMVKALHKNGIEVILDVVFNHTEEGNDKTHYYNFRGIDNPEYYMVNEKGDYLNFSGCGNTFNCNQYVALQLILSSLRYWVSEMHIDGFRFDEASILTRDDNFEPMYPSHLLKMIKMDSILSKVKLIAEPWDAAGLYQQGQFPSFGKWSEWNSQYRDTIRRFLKGAPQQKGLFARRVCGSQDLYERWQSPSCSINFITAHDGFTLRDLVTYEKKNNWSNGEENRDGDNNNESRNYGIEGETSNPEIQAIRDRQIRNFLLTLFISQGIPMLLMGDEYGHTKYGNNNTWCHDDELNWFLWDKLEENQSLFHFVSFLIHFRKNHAQLLCRNRFLKDSDIDWHGKKPLEPNWQSNENLIAFTLKDTSRQDLYVAFNPSDSTKDIELPSPLIGFTWYRIVDTIYLDHLKDEPLPNNKLTENYTLAPYSILMAKLFPENISNA
jgi:isoamylase/glycogen operon protein